MSKFEYILGVESDFFGAVGECTIKIREEVQGHVIEMFCTESTIPYKGVVITAMRRIIKEESQHSDNLHVNHFANVMKKKLSECREKGRSGWEECPIEFLNNELIRHIEKGDPVDVANFAMMIYERNEKIKKPEPKLWTVQDQKAGRLPEFLSFVYYEGENFEFVGVCVNEELWTLKCSDGKCIRVLKSKISPIESPDEKAKREEDDFVAENCLKDKPILCGTGFQIYERGFRDAFRKLKGLKQ